MLKHLFKLNLLWINKVALYFLGGALIFGLGSRLTGDLSSVAGLFLHNTLQSLAISGAIGLICNVFARVIVRFKNGLLRDEAYLLRTLPVEPSTHWRAHTLSFVVSMLFCIVSLIGTFALLFLNKDLWEVIKTLVEENLLAVIFLFVIIVFETIALGFSIFSSIVLGYRAEKNRKLKMGLLVVLFYWGSQVLLLGLAFLLSQFVPSFNNIFLTSEDFTEVAQNFKSFFVLAGVFYAFYSVVLYFIGKHALEKGLDVE